MREAREPEFGSSPCQTNGLDEQADAAIPVADHVLDTGADLRAYLVDPLVRPRHRPAPRFLEVDHGLAASGADRRLVGLWPIGGIGQTGLANASGSSSSGSGALSCPFTWLTVQHRSRCRWSTLM